MSRAAAILWVSRRDRAVVAGALAGIVALAWAYILLGAGMHTAMNMAMGDVMMPMPWTLATFRVMLVMWIVMMTAMMLPSAAPMILLFATINRRRSETGTRPWQPPAPPWRGPCSCSPVCTNSHP
jgi:predicted metal-binding membrane protein